MADYSLCQRSDCPRAQDCFRFRAIPDPLWQAYGVFDPEACEHFVRADGWPERMLKSREHSAEIKGLE